MLIHEFRVPMHMTVEEFQVAQLYMVVDASEKNTKGGEGVEILKNEPYDNTNGQLGDISPISQCKIPRNKGQYTLKHYHVKSHIPPYISAICPEDSMVLIEEAWNAYPHCLTVITNGYLSKHKFFISIESKHVAGPGDGGKSTSHDGVECHELTSVLAFASNRHCQMKPRLHNP
ncbi:hypothetical protein Ae201684P_004298 [Aphanomyces euteiches]|nr:hypothetical protein Ae201684P_004298 [Aphanomyces euteiches]